MDVNGALHVLQISSTQTNRHLKQCRQKQFSVGNARPTQILFRISQDLKIYIFYDKYIFSSARLHHQRSIVIRADVGK